MIRSLFRVAQAPLRQPIVPLLAAPFSTTTQACKAKAVTPYSLPFDLPAFISTPKNAARESITSQSHAITYQQIPHPRENISTPKAFIDAISYPPRRVLADDSSLMGVVGEPGVWAEFWKIDSHVLKKAGVGVKERRYVLWAMEKYRQGFNPSQFRIKPKQKKIVRGWGPRVQKGYRVSGRRRPGEKSL